MKTLKGITIRPRHKENCPPDKKTRKKCSCPRHIGWRIFPNGPTAPPELKSYGQYTPQKLKIVEDLLTKRRNEILRGEAPSNEREVRVLFKDFLPIYEELHMKNLPTYKSFGGTRRYLLDYFGDMYLDEVTWENVRDWRKSMTKQLKHLRRCDGNKATCKCPQVFLKESTINRVHTVLTHMFNSARRWKATKEFIKKKLLPGQPKLAQDNPGSLVKKANEKNMRRTRVLDIQEFEKLLAHAKLNVQWICRAAISVLLRRKDLVHLTKEKYDPETKSIKGTQFKTLHPFNVRVDPVLGAYIEAHPGGRLFNFHNFRKDFEAAVKAAGIKDFIFKDLRRTGATWLYRKGVRIDVISQMLGHASILMTERYIGIDTDGQDKAINTMEGLFKAPEMPNWEILQNPALDDDSKVEGLALLHKAV